MSIPSFDPKTVSGYDYSGQETAQKMYEFLSAHSLGLFYEPSSEMFTVLGSASLKNEEIEKIFAENKYHDWKPSVLEEVDSDGNHLVRLICVIEDRSSGTHQAAQRAFPVIEKPIRDAFASQLVSNLQSLGVSFNEKTCIDVGCGSGENGLAMQKAGA